MENSINKLIPFFESHKLQLTDNVRFHDFNLAIGKNGSGKTLFLKSIEAYYRDNLPDKAEVVTLYFPEIRSFFSTESDEDFTENPTVELVPAIFDGESLNFQDFLKIAQRDNVVFLKDFFMFMSARSNRTRQRYEKELGQLNEKLHRFLGWELDKTSINDGEIAGYKTIDNQICDRLPLAQMLEVFSPGELMLFYFCLFLFYLEHVEHSQLILIIDEPEQHLHPKVLIDLVKALRNEKSVAQIWLATHSLFLLPLFEFEQLVYIKQNKILKLNRNTYLDIYNDLVGFKNIDMYELIRSVENWAYYQFIAENFLLPASKDTVSKNDEQFRKLMSSLESKKNLRPMNVLDYGAGKFRIWQCLQLELPDERERAQVLCYEAYEPYPKKGVECPKSVQLYTKKSNLPQGHYDVVVLMNVLHEIDPTEWCENLETIHRVLAEEGILVFLEVLSLTNGEQPYGEAGYLLLQDQETKYLFPNAQQISLENTEKMNKSNCWVIPRSDLANMTKDKVVNAIGMLEKNCESQLERLDQKRIDFAHKKRDGGEVAIKATARQYAFLAQQYINAHIAYKRLAISLPSKTIDPKTTVSGKLPIRELK